MLFQAARPLFRYHDAYKRSIPTIIPPTMSYSGYSNMRCRQISLAIGRRDPPFIAGNKTHFAPAAFLRGLRTCAALSVFKTYFDRPARYFIYGLS